jgi:phage protein D
MSGEQGPESCLCARNSLVCPENAAWGLYNEYGNHGRSEERKEVVVGNHKERDVGEKRRKMSSVIRQEKVQKGTRSRGGEAEFERKACHASLQRLSPMERLVRLIWSMGVYLSGL